MNIIDSTFEAFRQLNREHLHLIWRMAREGALDGLTGEEKQLAEIMLTHSDEYFNQFEFADVLADREFNPESEVNPFLHVVLHAVIENQLKNRDPIEAFQFYNAMLRNKCISHEATHLLMTILLKYLFPILQKKSGKFDLDGYRKLLKTYKTRKPDKIFGLLESEPDSFVSEAVDPKTAHIFDEMHSAIKDQDFGSIEEAQAFADAWLEKKNAEPNPEFLGLSPEQMYRMLYQPFEEASDIVTFNRNLSKEDLVDIPVLKETVFFLKRLGELQPLKATARGNLPRAFAREIHGQFPEDPEFHYPIMSEKDDSKLSSLRHILDMAGWIKKRNQRFCLTKRGQILNEKGFASDDFYHLLKTYTQKFNWASRDFYPEPEIIQQAFLFSCYLLHKKAKTYIHVNELSTCFIEVFPTVLNEMERDPFIESEKLVRRIFYLRFIERFCEYFGLVTIQRKERLSFNLDYSVKTTPFFEEIFNWKLEG